MSRLFLFDIHKLRNSQNSQIDCETEFNLFIYLVSSYVLSVGCESQSQKLRCVYRGVKIVS